MVQRREETARAEGPPPMMMTGEKLDSGIVKDIDICLPTLHKIIQIDELGSTDRFYMIWVDTDNHQSGSKCPRVSTVGVTAHDSSKDLTHHYTR